MPWRGYPARDAARRGSGALGGRKTSADGPGSPARAASAGPDDRTLCRRSARLRGAPRACRVVAAGDDAMHALSPRALAMMLAAMRLNTTRGGSRCCARSPNGERHLRGAASSWRASIPPELLAQTLAVPLRVFFLLRISGGTGAARQNPIPAWPDSPQRASCGAIQAGAPERRFRSAGHEHELRADRRGPTRPISSPSTTSCASRAGHSLPGRGSAANSAVCFGLGITEVDPARIEMLFERFISKERNEPPDIDVDFEHERREEVIQYIYAKYGRDRAALTRHRHHLSARSAALRDVGKALGFPLGPGDAPGRIWRGGTAASCRQRLRRRRLRPATPGGAALAWPTGADRLSAPPVAARRRLRHPRAGSSRLVPIENAAMPERTVIQWDKDDLDAGLFEGRRARRSAC